MLFVGWGWPGRVFFVWISAVAVNNFLTSNAVVDQSIRMATVCVCRGGGGYECVCISCVC